ncbi:MAG: hypothetical protein J2P25_15495 [Nocardiopsaceae bacterium]|nr:hypothetical protein [Nocardiopsaceae bacterium]
MTREQWSGRSSVRETAEPNPSTTFCTWEVLPSDSRHPIIASGISANAGKARHDVEVAMAMPHAGFGHLVRTAIPGMSPDLKDRLLWPPLGEVQQCRRNRKGGFSWHALYSSVGLPLPDAEEALSRRRERTSELRKSYGAP